MKHFLFESSLYRRRKKLEIIIIFWFWILFQVLIGKHLYIFCDFGKLSTVFLFFLYENIYLGKNWKWVASKPKGHVLVHMSKIELQQRCISEAPWPTLPLSHTSSIARTAFTFLAPATQLQLKTLLHRQIEWMLRRRRYYINFRGNLLCCSTHAQLLYVNFCYCNSSSELNWQRTFLRSLFQQVLETCVCVQCMYVEASICGKKSGNICCTGAKPCTISQCQHETSCKIRLRVVYYQDGQYPNKRACEVGLCDHVCSWCGENGRLVQQGIRLKRSADR